MIKECSSLEGKSEEISSSLFNVFDTFHFQFSNGNHFRLFELTHGILASNLSL
jgi:hypothetical protein